MYLAGLGKKNNLDYQTPTASPQTEPTATPAPPSDEQTPASSTDSPPPLSGTTNSNDSVTVVLDSPVLPPVLPSNDSVADSGVVYTPPPAFQKEPTFFQKAWTILINALMKWFR